MQRFLTLLLLTGLCRLSAQAQLDSADKKVVNQAAFLMTKATVEFVASDKVTFGNLAKTTCDACADYPSLIQFIKASKLTKADELVRDSQKEVAVLSTSTATADQILQGLRQFLNVRVTKGEGRERRTTLPSYKVYTAEIAQILSNAGAGANGSTPETDEQLGAVSADTLDTENLVATGSSVTKADSGIFSYGGFALLLAILDLAGLVYVWSLRGKKTAPVTSSLSDPQLAELSKRVVTLERERKDLLNRIATLEKGVSSVVERAVPAPEPQRPASVTPKPNPVPPAPEPPRQSQATPPVAGASTPMSTPAPRPPAPVPQPAFQNQVAPSNQPRRREVVLYGRTADLGDGFSVGSLLETPDRDTVFQIEVRTDSQAVYRITEEPGAQQLALSDPYSYLADACEYLAKPTPNARIRTNQPGQLALQGDKWKIVEKAKISFY